MPLRSTLIANGAAVVVSLRAANRHRVAATAVRTSRTAIALTHQRIVRVFRHARQRHREQLIRSAVAIRREDERLSVGRQLTVRLVPLTLRDVVFLLRLDVVEEHLGVLLVVAAAVDEPIAVGRIL